MNAKRMEVLVIIAFIVACGFVIGGATTQSGGTPHAAGTPLAATPSPGARKAEEQFKNIQVLKGVPAEEIFPTMQFITASLGVECEFCHVKNAFEKDDKKNKQTARKMMEMMFAINKDNFENHRSVTCYSCHRGTTTPQAIPAVMTEEAKPDNPKQATGASTPAKSENSGPSADQLLDRYVQAVGGAAAVDKVNSRIMTGTIDFGGTSLPIDIYAKEPEQRISFTHMPEGDNVTAFNGKEGWLGTPGHPLREMHGSDLDGASIDADLHLPTHLKTMFTELRTEGSEKIGDHNAYVVVGRREPKPPIRLYFDEQSGLLLRLLRFGETALGWMPTQIDYTDYRDTNGVRIPYRWTLARPSGRFTIQVNNVKQNVPVDDAKFIKPAVEPPKGPGK
ncbi:MAG TPA: c-type cytochrome [Candidatus Sulfotelmatobacter sp.]|nr:c-type cytochrome [Candidatus Sulfotelmatobacter sp.]